MLSQLTLPIELPTATAPIVIRRATPDDLPALMGLLSDDPISASRGDVADPADEPLYRRALEGIIGDPGNEVILATDPNGALVGTVQLTLIPGMARRGAWRLQIEAVRVATSLRSSGIGTALMSWTISEAAPALGATLVQLTSDSARLDAHRFYERLGFVPSHTGFKLDVDTLRSPVLSNR